jgi:hypothetical protein
MTLGQPLREHLIVFTLVVRVSNHLLVEGLARSLQLSRLGALGSAIADLFQLLCTGCLARFLHAACHVSRATKISMHSEILRIPAAAGSDK